MRNKNTAENRTERMGAVGMGLGSGDQHDAVALREAAEGKAIWKGASSETSRWSSGEPWKRGDWATGRRGARMHVPRDTRTVPCTRTLLRGVLASCLVAGTMLASAAMSQEIGVGVPFYGPKSQELADEYGDSLAQEWEGTRDSSTIRNLLWQVKDFGPPSELIRASLVAVLAGIITDTADFQEITQYLAVTLLDDWRTEGSAAVSALESGLEDTSRDLVRLASGVALVKLGYVQEALPVVEEYAEEGWEYADTLDTTHWVLGDNADPVTPFYWTTWREEDPASEDSLNAYMTRVLSYPIERRRIQAIEFLLVKGVSTEQALDAAHEIVEDPEPCSDGDVEYAEQLNLVHKLRKYGGARGRAIAEEYER